MTDTMEKRWDDKMVLMNQGITAVFTNDLERAEELFQQGMQHEKPTDENEHDIRGGFALMYAIVAVLRGIGSLADDQLNECAIRLQRADELASEDHDWIGRAVIRGVCTLATGLIQCLQFSFVTGVWNILKSWMWIKRLPVEAIEYEGKEREVVRSAALFTVGLFNMLISFLPSSMISAAAMISGMQGSRSEGLQMLEDCYHEGGILSPYGALVWIIYQVDTKTFLGELQTEEDFAACTKILTWAEAKYPKSVFFNMVHADMLACQKNVAGAVERVQIIKPLIGELKALQWAYSYKRGVYALPSMDWVEAATDFSNSLNIYVEVGRRSMVPFMAAYSALCYYVEAFVNNENKYVEEAEKMIDLVKTYREMPKDNWGRQDLWAFRLLERYDFEDYSQQMKLSILLELCECMAFRMRCTRWMNDQQCQNLVQLLKRDEKHMTIDQRVQMEMCCAEIYYQNGDKKEAKQACEQGVQLEQSVSASGVDHGMIPMLLYMQALLECDSGNPAHAKELLNRVKGYGKSYWLHPFVVFKSSVLSKRIGFAFENAYESATVDARNSYEVVVDVLENKTIEWDFVVKENDIAFKAEYINPKDNTVSLIQEINRQNASDPPVEFKYNITSGGKIKFTWDNSYSLLRSKQISYRVQMN